MKRKSINNFFQERCIGGCKSKDFWGTIKPYMSSKTKNNQNKIILNENQNTLSDNSKVADIFNDFYINVAKDIGKDFIFDKSNHPSIEKILGQNISPDSFNFTQVEQSTVSNILRKFNVKKATGIDKISIKLLKLGSQSLVPFYTHFINNSIDTGIFPDRLKQAQVTPVFKKNDPLEKSNYRPVSILPAPSKFFEKVLSNQLTIHFDNIFDNFLCAFRKGHGCQTTLLKLVEDWKLALDSNQYVAAILMDLSKAFDCLPHDILICKLECYGLSKNSINLLTSYLSNRKQQIKVGNSVSSWANIIKGVPQGSILGPLLFNIFLNDIFYFIHRGTLYNYADDNTLSFCSSNFNELVEVLQEESNILIDWFTFNCMQANPDKFQAIAIGSKTSSRNPNFDIKNANIECDDIVKLLGVNLDSNLNFDFHIRSI